MTIKEMIEHLNAFVSLGIDPNTYVVVRSEEFDPDPDVECIYYDEEADRLCVGIE